MPEKSKLIGLYFWAGSYRTLGVFACLGLTGVRSIQFAVSAYEAKALNWPKGGPLSARRRFGAARSSIHGTSYYALQVPVRGIGAHTATHLGRPNARSLRLANSFARFSKKKNFFRSFCLKNFLQSFAV